MKNVLLSAALIFTGASLMALSEPTNEENAIASAQVSNVGDGQSYHYHVTEVSDTEIHGLPLNRISDGNRGIFLYTDEVSFDVQVGDHIAVVWGEEEDIFESITLLDRAEDGEHE